MAQLTPIDQYALRLWTAAEAWRAELGTTPEETPRESRLRRAGEKLNAALSIAVTGEPGGNVRRNVLYLVAGATLVGSGDDVIVMVGGIVALILLALGDTPR